MLLLPGFLCLWAEKETEKTNEKEEGNGEEEVQDVPGQREDVLRQGEGKDEPGQAAKETEAGVGGQEPAWPGLELELDKNLNSMNDVNRYRVNKRERKTGFHNPGSPLNKKINVNYSCQYMISALKLELICLLKFLSFEKWWTSFKRTHVFNDTNSISSLR